MHLTRTTILRHFQLFRPSPYPQESLHYSTTFATQKLRKAAVLVGFVERHSELYVIFTKRSMHLKHHPGQVSFPGGKCEQEDASIYQTAMREAQEEIGLTGHEIELIGCLPELHTTSRFSVTPVLAFVSSQYKATIQQDEVEEVFEVPASYLLNPNHLYSYPFILKQSRHQVFALSYQRHLIWGATAQIIQSLQKQLLPHSIQNSPAEMLK